jgi:uncharacterized protein (TIGR00255 family)
MIKSMTGYGLAVTETDTFTISAEVKTLNSKFMDLSLRLPKGYAEKELEIRNLITQILERGKVNVQVDVMRKGDVKPKVMVNRELVKAYYLDLEATAQYIGIVPTELFRMALQMPEVMVSDVSQQEDNSEIPLVIKTVTEALQKADLFRTDEGNSLKNKLREYIDKIGTGLSQIEQSDKRRMVTMRERLRERVQELSAQEGLDENRFEQELIYYIEKLDISEEKVRLKTHLDYFIEAMDSQDANGKKLGFIAQEIGREINTIGSKANDAEVQRYVINMKEELEKIKEQSLNVI